MSEAGRNLAPEASPAPGRTPFDGLPAWLDRHAGGLAGGSPALEGLRRRALALVLERGLPTPREEAWRHTNLRALARRNLLPARTPAPGDAEAALAAPELARPISAQAELWITIDGHVLRGSGAGEAGGSVRVERLSELVRTDPERAAGILDTGMVTGTPSKASGSILGESTGEAGAGATVPPGLLERRPDPPPLNVFELLNAAIAADGLVVTVTRQEQEGDPPALELVHLCGPGGEHVGAPFLWLALEEGASLRLIERYLSTGNGAGVSAPRCRIALARGARLEHYRLQSPGEEHFQVGVVNATLGPGAALRSHVFASGGRISRLDYNVWLDGPEAQCDLGGLYAAGSREHIDLHLRVDHRAVHGTSRQGFRGVLDGRGRGVFNGAVVVHPGAQKADAEQSNHNLLLSRRAEVDTKPELQIFADDVRCSHGATVGQLDENAVFYLRSRGLDAETARALLTLGFAHSSLQEMPLEAARRWAQGALAAALPALSTLAPLES